MARAKIRQRIWQRAWIYRLWRWPSYYSENLGYRENSKPASEHAVCAIYQPEKGRRVAPLLVEAIRVALELDPIAYVLSVWL